MGNWRETFYCSGLCSSVCAETHQLNCQAHSLQGCQLGAFCQQWIHTLSWEKGISVNEGGIHGNYSIFMGGLFFSTNALSFLMWALWSLQVTNVDDEGNELGSGIMELTQTELILHTHKRDAVRWPYLCLRRYGYDSNLFSFESGRRCQTGQGECGGSWRKKHWGFCSQAAGVRWCFCLPKFLHLMNQQVLLQPLFHQNTGACMHIQLMLLIKTLTRTTSWLRTWA